MFVKEDGRHAMGFCTPKRNGERTALPAHSEGEVPSLHGIATGISGLV